MEKKLAIQWFIEQNRDWETLLAEKPYCITIQRDNVLGRNLILFKYSQVDSDMSIGLVRECRGLILDEDTLEPVCVPFFKFFNAGETYADDLDWSTAWTSEKLDGSICKVVRLGNDILVSTNGVIDAFKAPVQDQIGCVGQTFGSLFQDGVANAMKKYTHGKACFDWFVPPLEWLKSLIEEGHTYMFELTSPFNKVVVTWRETMVHFIGCRNNRTGQELKFFEHPLAKYFHTPEIFHLRNLSECREAAEKFDCNHEGFVVCDKNFRRLKVKSTVYCSLHHMKNNGVLSFERGIDIVRGNELDEVLAYFPEFGDHLNKIKADFDKMKETLFSAWDRFASIKDTLPNRKEQALVITSKDYFGKFSGVGFALLDGKIGSVEEWLKNVPSKSLVKFLGYKE